MGVQTCRELGGEVCTGTRADGLAEDGPRLVDGLDDDLDVSVSGLAQPRQLSRVEVHVQVVSSMQRPVWLNYYQELLLTTGLTFAEITDLLGVNKTQRTNCPNGHTYTRTDGEVN